MSSPMRQSRVRGLTSAVHYGLGTRHDWAFLAMGFVTLGAAKFIEGPAKCTPALGYSRFFFI
ncbi:MAG: hypothetical protein ACI9W4_000445 [Rhodothermales bacterium]|jgi:hypothetical protein